MNSAEAHALFEQHGALRSGHFKLSSGRHSDTYAQCALVLQWPGIAERLGHELGERFEDADPTVVLGPAMGGVIIAHEVASYLDVRCVFSERVSGEMSLRRGFSMDASDRVVICEDVVTTGRSPKEAVALCEATGATVVGVGAVIDRSKGVSFGSRFVSLLRLDAESWDADECPLCETDVPVDAPGSRHLVP